MAEYIEREALLKWAREFYSNDLQFASAVINALTADVAKVGHGKWIRMEDDVVYWYACSECKNRIPKNQFGFDYYADYCPNCGAKMDLGDEEGCSK